MNQMGNLEKFGILVIVILVVVVGVVAITPKDQVDAALFPTESPPDAAQLEPIDDASRGGDTAGANAADPRDWPLPPLKVTEADIPPRDRNLGGGAVADVEQSGPNRELPPAPQSTQYTVQKGDTPSSIASKLLGKASLWTLIADANPGLDPKRMRIGQVLTIPARPDSGATAQRTAATVPPVLAQKPAPDRTASTGERTIVVQPGETLTAISRRELKSASRWRELRDYNEDVLHGSDQVRGGMKLRIPPQTGGATVQAPPSGTGTGTNAASSTSYTVRKGDTLTSIASRVLGTSSRWREIRDANSSLLHGSENIVENMVLTIPDQVSAR